MPDQQGRLTPRDIAALLYIKGEGIEVGALNIPLAVPQNVKVRYVDRMNEVDLRLQYPELSNTRLVPIDVIDDGETLKTFNDSSQDFVIANHFLEHAQDPIGTLKSMLRVLKPGGVLYLAVPDKRRTFDVDRPVTSFEHLVDDHKNGPAATRMSHFEEWVRLVDKKTGDEYDKKLNYLLEMNYSIHFHVWDKAAITHFLNTLQDELGYDLEFNMQNGFEVINVLRKRVPPGYMVTQ